jgi:hypothetical protein
MWQLGSHVSPVPVGIVWGYPPPPSPFESWSYMLLRLKNIDSRGVTGKILRNKDLARRFAQEIKKSERPTSL